MRKKTLIHGFVKELKKTDEFNKHDAATMVDFLLDDFKDYTFISKFRLFPADHYDPCFEDKTDMELMRNKNELFRTICSKHNFSDSQAAKFESVATTFFYNLFYVPTEDVIV